MKAAGQEPGELQVWGLPGACIRLMTGAGGSQAGALVEEGLLGPGQGEGDAGNSEAGCPGHRIIVVKYSWAFSPDAISEQREQEGCVSLRKERAAMPFSSTPTSTTTSLDRPTYAHHVHTHARMLPLTHTHKMELQSTCRHTSHPRVPQTGRCTPNTDKHAYLPNQDPLGDHPFLPQYLTHTDPQLLQTTQIHHLTATHPEIGGTFKAIQSNPLSCSDGETEVQRGEGTNPRL